MKRVALFAALAALSVTAPVLAGDISAADKKTLRTYTLTMPRVKAFEASTVALRAAGAKDPSLKADYNAASAELTSDMNGEFAKMDHHPRVFAFFAKNGLTKQDVVLIPLTLMSACLVAQYPASGPGVADEVSPAQVAFCKSNLTAIYAMNFMKGGG
jgi:hypothetical protein